MKKYCEICGSEVGEIGMMGTYYCPICDSNPVPDKKQKDMIEFKPFEFPSWEEFKKAHYFHDVGYCRTYPNISDTITLQIERNAIVYFSQRFSKNERGYIKLQKYANQKKRELAEIICG